MRQEQSGLDPSYRIVNQSRELLPLFLGDRGPQVLNFNESFADKNYLGDLVNSGHPRVADELRIQGGNAHWLFGVSGRGRLPFEDARRAVEFSDGVDIGYKIAARAETPIELNLLG